MLEIQKIRKDINWLIEQMKCLMKKSDADCPLEATEWSPNHSVATGNPYILGCFVWLNGHVYESLIDDNTYPPTNDCYWTDLGEGHLLLEEQSNWDATTGRAFIRNKPTNTSDFVNDGEDGSSPYATEDYVNNAIPPPQNLESVLNEGDTAPSNNANINELGLYDDFGAPGYTPGFAKIYADKFRFWFKDKTGTIIASIRANGLGFNIGSYTFSVNFPNITGNRTASFQNASGVVAYLTDIPTADIVATIWSPYHTTATGNPYLTGTRVFYNGHVYQALHDNDGIVPTNTTYWSDLGAGYLLDQELNPVIAPFTLDETLQEGNTSQRDANIGVLGLWQPNVDNGDGTFGSYGYISLYSDPAAPTISYAYIRGGGLDTPVLFETSDNGLVHFKNGHHNPIFDFSAITDNRTWNWRNMDGVVAFLSDIPTQTSQLINNGANGVNPFITALDIPQFASANKMVTTGRNSTGATLYKGTVIYILLSTGNRPNFVKAQANAEATSAGTFGVILADIPNNTDGECVTIGAIDTLDTRTIATHPFTTDTLVDGDTLYLSPTTAGYVTNVKPSAPNHLVYLGKVVRSHPTLGTIVYRIQNGYELEELHNVAISGVADKDYLVYEAATSLWKNKPFTSVLGYTPADDATFLYNKFMTNHFSYMLPGENSTYNLLRTNTTAGYITAGTVATLSQMPMGISYTTGIATSSIAAVFGAPMKIQLSNAQDFTFQRKWKVQITSSVQRYFVGITNKYITATPVNADQTLFLNVLGVVKLDTSSNWFFIFNDGAGVATTIDCGTNFPATNAYSYSLKIQKVKGATSLTMTLTRIDNTTGATFEISQVVNSTDYNTGVDYNPAIWVSNNTAPSGSQFYDYGCMLLKSTI